MSMVSLELQPRPREAPRRPTQFERGRVSPEMSMVSLELSAEMSMVSLELPPWNSLRK